MTTSAFAGVASQVAVQTRPALEDFLKRAETNFVTRFGQFVASSHREELGEIFAAAGRARLEVFFATDEKKAIEWEDTYSTELDRIETLGLGLLIVGKAETRKFLRDEMHMILSYVPAVAGVVVRIALPIALPGIGAVAAPFAGAGAEWFLSKFFGTAGQPPAA